MGMTKKDIELIWEGVAPVLRDYVARAVEPIGPRLLAIEKRLTEMEKSPFVYEGVYQSARNYSRGTFVTFDGAIWHCNKPSVGQKPGTDSSWSLACKSGGAR